MHRVLKVIPLLVLFTISIPLTSLAEVAQRASSTGADDEHLVHYRHSEATNPRCAAVAVAHDVGGGSVGTGLGMALSGMILMQFASTLASYVAAALISGGITAVSAGIAMDAPYYVCNWSFVRHPVLRGKHNQRNSGPVHAYTDGDSEYSECMEPISPKGADDPVLKKYKDKTCDKEFANMEDYYTCLANGTGGAGSKLGLEEVRRSEPICPGRKFTRAEKYAWPKNRVSSSKVIEVCYRYPLGDLATAPFTLFAMSFYERSYTELLKDYSDYPRESTFGSPEMHRTKLSVSGALYTSKAKSYVQCASMVAGEEKQLFDATFRAVERGANLCVDAVKLSGVPLLLQPEIGCQLRPNSPPVPMCATSKPIAKNGQPVGSSGSGLKPDEIAKYDNSSCYSCYISEVCKGVAGLYSRSVFPVTSVIVGCVVGSLKNLLEPPKECLQVNTNIGFLKVAQSKLKSTVMAALILALILFSIKAVLGGVQNTSDLYMTAIKFALVIYFTQGSAMSEAYDYLTKLSIGLSDIVLQAGGGNGICDFKSGDYEKGFEYLMPWDRLDCRVMFYLGSQLTGGTGTGVVLSVLLSAGLLIAAVLINAKVIICLVALFAVLMLVLTVIWTVYVFLLSLIALTVLTIISPLMIPMCLFQATKGFFDGWIRQLMTYSLYPVILFAFLSLMFTVFDQIYFGNLEFKRGDNGNNTSVIGDPAIKQGLSLEETRQRVKPKIWFELKEKCACEKRNDNLACLFDSVRFHSRPLFLGISVGTPEFKMQATAQIWTRLGVFVLVGFLFYHFLSSISYIAGELAGDPRAGGIGSGGMNPRAMAHRATGMASSLREKATGKVSDLGEKMRDAIKGGGSEGGDKVSGTSSGRDNSSGG